MIILDLCNSCDDLCEILLRINFFSKLDLKTIRFMFFAAVYKIR